MSDIFKRDLESGRRFSNDPGEAETRDVYAEMMEAEQTAAVDNMKKIKEQLTESTANSFKEIHEGLLDSILKMKKFIIENDLRNEDVDKLIGEAEEAYSSAGKLIVESIVKG
tara:strand:- start:318 stop:653 length:336 start_codon:yes stop_codon:yes gene_type:complete